MAWGFCSVNSLLVIWLIVSSKVGEGFLIRVAGSISVVVIVIMVGLLSVAGASLIIEGVIAVSTCPLLLVWSSLGSLKFLLTRSVIVVASHSPKVVMIVILSLHKLEPFSVLHCGLILKRF
jgi:hypothetical protein